MRNRIRAITAVAALTLGTVALVARSEDPAATKRIHWKGRAGDAADPFDPPGWNRPDLVAVDLRGQRGEIVVTLTFDRDLERTLNQKTGSGKMKGYLLAELGFDIDHDEATGKTFSSSSAGRSKGYDFTLQINTGVKVTSGDFEQTTSGSVEVSTGSGRVGSPVISCAVSARSTAAYEINSKYEVKSSRQPRHEMRGKTLVVRVPYERLGLKNRRTVRVCALDHTTEPFSERRLFPATVLGLE